MYIFGYKSLTDEAWANTQETTLLWQFISGNQNQQFHQFIIEQPRVITVRSSDGRGALWWAWEYENAEALAILAVNGEDIHHTKKDSENNRAMDLCKNYDAVLAKAQSMVKEKMGEKQYIEEQIKKAKEQMYFNEDEVEEEYDEEWEDTEEDEDFTVVYKDILCLQCIIYYVFFCFFVF